ncbi:hypothetical protein AYI96_18010 [Shewanella sp. MSW]|nr:hypothetical protein AYI96_18010 [Shewanella sp. MSW]
MQVFYRYQLYRVAAKANLSQFPNRQAGYASVLFLAIFATIDLTYFHCITQGWSLHNVLKSSPLA